MSTPALPAAVLNHPAKTRLPLTLKVVYTVFVAVLVPYYWQAYGPTNFLYFCDVALLVTVAGLWLESPLLASMQAVAIVLPQIIWNIDLLSIALFGTGPVGLTGYMFDPQIPLFVRGLSSFHAWLPFLLVYMVWRLGYDRRAFWLQTAFGCSLLLFCYFFTPAPPAPASHPTAAVNVNYVFGLSGSHEQTWMDGRLWICLLLVVFPTCIYLPTHLVLKRLFGKAPVDSHPSSVASLQN